MAPRREGRQQQLEPCCLMLRSSSAQEGIRRGCRRAPPRSISLSATSARFCWRRQNVFSLPALPNANAETMLQQPESSRGRRTMSPDCPCRYQAYGAVRCAPRPEMSVVASASRQRSGAASGRQRRANRQRCFQAATPCCCRQKQAGMPLKRRMSPAQQRVPATSAQRVAKQLCKEIRTQRQQQRDTQKTARATPAANRRKEPTVERTRTVFDAVAFAPAAVAQPAQTSDAKPDVALYAPAQKPYANANR